jgi:hypothetical protein
LLITLYLIRVLITAKQRNGDWEGTLGLWFDKKSQQFKEGFNQSTIQYLEEN